MLRFRWVYGAFGCVALALLAVVSFGQSRTYTTDADFDEGVLASVNHDTPNNDQLQMNSAILTPFPFISVACSDRGTVVRIDVNTGAILGEYLSAPAGRPRNPSRTTVDRLGNTWCTNRDESGGDMGSCIKIGLVVGGTRGVKNPDGSFTPDPLGEYLQPPFDYSTCPDRDGDGLIRTSRGLGHILAWPDFGDSAGGPGGAAAFVSDALDECILVFQRLPGAPNARHVSVDANNDVWVGGYPFSVQNFHLLSGVDGSILRTLTPAQRSFCGGYGGLVDGNGVIWSATLSQNTLMRYDPATNTPLCIGASQSYGLGLDNNGFIWNALWTNNSIIKVSPAGVIQPGFPKPTGGSCCRGVAVTPDNTIWVANSCSNTVSHLDNNGNLIKTVPVGGTPTGVAVDSNGKVWVTNYTSHNVMRIDPAVASGTVDLTVTLGAGAGPYNYSDMTGTVSFGSTLPTGTWTVVFDAGAADVEWGAASWSSLEPAGTSIGVAVRAANAVGDLGSAAYQAVANGVSFDALGISGRYIQIRATFNRPGGSAATPILYDLTIEASPTGARHIGIDVFPFLSPLPNRVYLSKPTRKIPVLVIGAPDFNTPDLNPATVRFGPTGTEAPPMFAPTFFDGNGDGFVDAMYDFRTSAAGFVLADTLGRLTGMTFGGIAVEGSDAVAPVP